MKVAVAGVGSWATTLAGAIRQSESLELVACFSRTPETRKTFAEEHECRASPSFQEMVEDPEVEAVLIVTSHQSHLPLIEAAAAAGKHMFVEKPLTLSVEDGRAAVAAAARAGVVLQVGHQRRRTPGLRGTRRLIDDGKIGEIQLLEANFSSPMGLTMAADVWRRDPREAPLGAMTSLGIHHVDSFLYLAGPVDSVFAMTRPGRDGSLVDESTILLTRFESGALGTLATSMFVPRVSRLTIQGSSGSAFVEDDGLSLQYQATGEALQEVPLSPTNPVVEQLEDFAAAVRGEIPAEVSGEDALAVVAVMEAAIESIKSGRPSPVG